MKVLEIKSKISNSSIYVGEKFTNLHKFVDTDNFIIITDKNINRIYGDQINSSCYNKSEKKELNIIEIGMGEQIKTLDTISEITKQLIDIGADRSTLLIGIGGGVVCDITGFVASIYMRGIKFGFVSTTLLSQIDASTGGKNGVNFNGFKNMIGTFNQPNFVICDQNLLNTLEIRQQRSGFAEMIKHAVIKDIKHFEFIEDNIECALKLDNLVMEKLIYDSVLIKVSVVKNDEKEEGERKLLNFGHTIGHAIEKIYGLFHGEAVSYGMSVAVDISVYLGLLSNDESCKIKNLLKQFELPVTIEEVLKLSTQEKEFKIDLIKETIQQDKKRTTDMIDLILISSIGKAEIKKIEINKLNLIIDNVFDTQLKLRNRS